VFRTTGAYDTAIANWLSGQLGEEAFPERMGIQLTKQQDLRYGENPHQAAAFYRRSTASAHALVNAEQLRYFVVEEFYVVAVSLLSEASEAIEILSDLRGGYAHYGGELV
jgi:AICAR transformylase/IMP cyclohydrolase PurH